MTLNVFSSLSTSLSCKCEQTRNNSCPRHATASIINSDCCFCEHSSSKQFDLIAPDMSLHSLQVVSKSFVLPHCCIDRQDLNCITSITSVSPSHELVQSIADTCCIECLPCQGNSLLQTLTWSGFWTLMSLRVTETNLPLEDGRFEILSCLTGPITSSTARTIVCVKSSPPEPIALKSRRPGYWLTCHSSYLSNSLLCRSAIFTCFVFWSGFMHLQQEAKVCQNRNECMQKC